MMVSANNLRAARAVRRLARQNDGAEESEADLLGGVDWLTVGSSGDNENTSVEEQSNGGPEASASGKRKRGGARTSKRTDADADAGVGTDMDMKGIHAIEHP